VKTIGAEERMEIVMQMLFWIHSRGEDNLQELSITYISLGYSAEQLLILEKAATQLYRKYLGD